MKFLSIFLLSAVLSNSLVAQEKKTRSLDRDDLFENPKEEQKALVIFENGGKLTAYELPKVDPRISSKNIEKLSANEKFKALDEINLAAEKEGKSLTVVSLDKRSIDGDEATSACLRRRASFSGPTNTVYYRDSTVYCQNTQVIRTTTTNVPTIYYTPSNSTPAPGTQEPNNYYRPGKDFENEKTSTLPAPVLQASNIPQYRYMTTVVMPSGQVAYYYYR